MGTPSILTHEAIVFPARVAMYLKNHLLPLFATVLVATSLPACASADESTSLYIVMVKDDATCRAASASMAERTRSVMARIATRGARVIREYGAIGGFAAHLSPEQIETLRQDPEVLSVQKDRIWRIPGALQGPIAPEANENVERADDFWPVKEWGLDRIDQRDLPLSKSFSIQADGTGVHAYMLDSGIHKTHQEFQGRIGDGYDFVFNDSDPQDDHNWINVRGHGSMTASIIGGKTWGVAKGVTLHAVKVLDSTGSGKGYNVLSGIDWVTKNAKRPAICNFSIEADRDDEQENPAVQRMIDAGIIVVAASGNSSHDASKSSPGSVLDALTVGATDNRDTVCAFSNFGSCVDLHAPGFMVGGASNKDNTAIQQASGTSQAAPYVSGAAALYLQFHPNATMAEVHDAITRAATTDKIKDSKGSANRILYINDAWISGGAPTPDPLPTEKDLIRNGSFENGRAPWIGSANFMGSFAEQPAFAGKKCLWLGGNGSPMTEMLQQEIQIPSNLTQALLTFQLHIDTAEQGNSIYDTLKVTLVNAQGDGVKLLGTYGNTDAAAGYLKRTFDLSAYKGQNLSLRFEATEDVSLQSSFVIDDVKLLVK